MGVPDEVDYAQIPWRSAQFDPEALEAALATEARAQNALDQFHRHRAGPAIGFCCSVRHAEFMAAFFRGRGLRAVAVHSGPGSAPRATSLDQLGRGEIDILFAVDMFNEGVDVPAIGTVMMLRPTESVILWLQQLGRGLRRVEGKVLRVIDYIGNHRVFLTKLRALLDAGPGDRSLALRLEQAVVGQLPLPPGCSVT
ncbi:helicase-like protein [Roseinatronobacter thiooxidans]|uniref:Helicase-like protein n=1 Tax=Roseinatronobacter thiooxidans TaxID=121821 RepID=A0A2W7PZ88_9RHOB|nr:helicase-related protein [Roseinatronobacter thiooxidans]PZX37237.1 helicase-like protein [Roseinatronobacter thiooxidans]